jgi:hypothetical protein
MYTHLREISGKAADIYINLAGISDDEVAIGRDDLMELLELIADGAEQSVEIEELKSKMETSDEELKSLYEENEALRRKADTLKRV